MFTLQLSVVNIIKSSLFTGTHSRLRPHRITHSATCRPESIRRLAKKRFLTRNQINEDDINNFLAKSWLNIHKCYTYIGKTLTLSFATMNLLKCADAELQNRDCKVRSTFPAIRIHSPQFDCPV